MSKFERALDSAFGRRKKELGRAPTVFTEMEELREQLFQEWLLADRFDDLISYIHYYHLDEGGIGDCSILCEALRKKGDLQRIERLFSKLISVRTTQFWHWWPKAQEGHIGAMRTCAKFATWATEAYAGLWHGYWSLGHEEGQERVRSEMLQFQQRIRAKKPGKRRAK